MSKQIEALKLARHFAKALAEQPAQHGQDQTEIAFEAWWQAHGQFHRSGGGDYEKTFAWHAWLASLACTEQPAQQQEPVAQEWRYYFSHSGATGKPDEVVGPCFTDKKEVAFGVGCFDQTALCPPASKPWVGLTDAEKYALTDDVARKGVPVFEAICEAEAKLREKNNG